MKMPSANSDNFFGVWPRNDANGNHCTTNHFSRTSPSTPRNSPYSSRLNSPFTSLPSSPINSSPISTSPVTTLRRNYSSTFTLIPEDRAIDTPPLKRYDSKKSAFGAAGSNYNIFIRIIIWWPLLLISLVKKILFGIFSILYRPFSFAAPTFWISACLWLFWKAIAFPISLIQYLLLSNNIMLDKNRTKRTVMISCGSTIQTLHLARNFYSAGARVVVFDFEGLFGLARFSTAVSKYYTVSKPTPDSPHDYVAALCNIVEKEKPSYYIPVCATSVSHYDALAKPHLELLGCSSFLPGTQEISVLDDILEILKKCKSHGIQLPPYQVLKSKEDMLRLYDNGWLTGYRNVLIECGINGILDRQKYVLPNSRRDFRLSQEISEERQWVVIRDLPGVHYVTCTTIKESKVVANVTCSVQQETRSLIPEKNADVEKWLTEFFAKVRLQRPINGHISFRFVRCDQTGTLYPLGTRVGVSLPYICHTGVQSRVICKPCPHFSRQNSGPIVQEGGRYWIHEIVLNTLKHPSVDAVGKLIGTVLDKREALFVYWDPLPYCAYYHFQLPFKSVKSFLQKRQVQRKHQTTLTAPVH